MSSNTTKDTTDPAETVLGQTLVFKAGSELFGLALDSVIEVFEQPRQTVSVPGAPDWLAGITNHHGQVYPVVRLDRLLKVDPPGQARQMLLVEIEKDKVALLVDQIKSLEIIRSEGPMVQGRKRAWLRGALMTLLEPATLGDSIRSRLS